MKKILLAAVAVLAIMVSCQKENVNAPLTLEEQLGFEIKSTFEATIVNDAADVNAPKDGMSTAAHLDGQNYVCWNDTDKISINGITHQTTITSLNEDNMTVNFYGSVEAPLGDDNNYHAFFPAGIQSTSDYNKGTLPAYQTFSYDGAISLPMYAVAAAPSHELAFHNICSILEITIPAGIEANKIEITADEALYGNFHMDNGKLVMDEGNGTKNTLTIAAATSTTWTSGTVVKCAIPGRPETNVNGGDTSYHNMTITIFKTDTTKIIRSKAKFKVKPSQIYRMKINCAGDAANTFVKATGNQNPSLFSVSANQKVYFTSGNLWYDGTNPHLELNQYEYPNHRNSGHIGHFYWAPTANDAAPANVSSTSVTTGSTLFCANNYTVNGESLRTLTATEWTYLVEHSTLKYVRIDGIQYLLIAPDNYTGTTLENISSFADIETNGLLCLPLSGLVTAAGNNDILIYKNDTKSGWRYGRYWSCDISTKKTSDAQDLNIGRLGESWLSDQMSSASNKISVTDDAKTSARCIRLVKNASAPQ